MPQSDTVLFELAPDQNVFKRIITVQGNTNGKFLIDQYEIQAGKVDTSFKSDWYSPDYILEYKPVDATEGSLTIDLELVAL